MLYREGRCINPQTFQNGGQGEFNNPHVLNKKMKVCLRWHENLATKYVVPRKKLRDEGLHTFLGMVGYCMKEMMMSVLSLCIIVLANDMNEGKTEYANFKKVGLNNCVSLSHSNISKGLTNGHGFI